MGIVWVSIFWLVGIYAGRELPLRPIQWAVLLILTILAALMLRKHRLHRSTYLLLIPFFLGALRARLDVKELSPDDVAFYNDLDLPVRITGTIVDDPEPHETYTALRVRAERLVIPDLDLARTIQGDILVHANPYRDWTYGDWVRVKGEIETPPLLDSFSYKDYLARKDIFSWMPQAAVLKLDHGRGNPLLRWIYQVRHRLYQTIVRILPEPEASLSAGILLGIESMIPDDVYEDFSRTGTTHIIAISGFNITLIANMIISLSRRFFGSRRGLFVAAFGITLYTILVGADAAVVRAAVMGGLALGARYWGRETLGLASLGTSSMLMTAFDPAVLWDVGFQLSFAATLGLVLYARPLQRWSTESLFARLSPDRAKQAGGFVSEFVLFTMAAQVTTWPLTVVYFQRFSFVSFLTNPMILPLQPPLMILSGAAAIAGTIWMPIGNVLALFAWPFPALTIRIVRLMARFATGGYGLSAESGWLIAGYYIILFGMTGALQFLNRDSRLIISLKRRLSGVRVRSVWLLVAAALATGFVWQSAANSADGLLHLTIFDVGSGDAVLIRSPAGENILIDGGKSPTKLLNQLGLRLPLLQRRLDWLILGGTHRDQMAGLVGLVDHLAIENALVPQALGSYSFQRVKELLVTSEVQMHPASTGQELRIDGSMTLEIIDCSDSGLILLIEYGRARILIPSGMTPEAVETIIHDHRMRDLSVMLLPDGGHPSVNPAEWLEITNPRVVILSVGGTGRTERPSMEVLDSLEGRTILRTDRHGTIEIISDGEALWVETERAFNE
ncbi:MAG: ComEC/Rec2 family competence protein [Anaerolineales bacterium]|nr:ComEC/Rec2 family competence protein [Anaerolineales bacterium]